jgi:hypothetical protein
MFVSRGGPRYSEAEARRAVAASRSLTEVLRRLGMRPAGGNHATLRKYIERWSIATDHFDSDAARVIPRPPMLSIEAVLTQNSTYSRGTLKKRLYREGLKQRWCELCGQGETWRGRRMSLILDHANGVADDNRLENLRIVCPNCAATLDTHCGRNGKRLTERRCDLCGAEFMPGYGTQRFCSRYCGQRGPRKAGAPKPRLRRVDPRPSHDQLLVETQELGFLGTGRKYGVSDNAIRKWIRAYERAGPELAT